MTNITNQDGKDLAQVDTATTVKNTELELFYGGSSARQFVIKKTEKLVSATYMVTGLMSDNEPMKWTLRREVSDLLITLSDMSIIRQVGMSNLLISLKQKISRITSLLQVCNSSGMLSEMNFSILKHEFLALLTNLSDSDFSTNLEYPNKLSSDFFSVKFEREAQSHGNHTRSIKDTLSNKDVGEFRSNNRQGIILGLLKKKHDLSIKDISLVIRDVSEKTIQRELISLIRAGVLLKTGQRRWSKYSLKQA